MFEIRPLTITRGIVCYVVIFLVSYRYKLLHLSTEEPIWESN